MAGQTGPINYPISDKNRREMSEERDFPESVPVSQRYLILSSPRSGSTLLGRMLYETRLAGDPQEYLNPPLLIIERQRSGKDEMNWSQFLKVMESRRTSPNGVFGMKLHYSQMLSAFQSRRVNQNMVKFLKQFDRVIWIRRRDRLRQGISQAIAMKSQVWSSEDTGKSASVSLEDIADYDCIRALNTVTMDDHGWETLIPAINLEVHEVWYEELVEQYQKESGKVLEYLGLGDQVETIPEPPLKKQATALNEDLRQRVLQYLAVEQAQS